MAQLVLSNVINISVSQVSAGAGNYNTSNVGLFSDEAPANSFGVLGYKQYIDPSGVATDFGSTSKTYAMALATFSQQPNILAGNGELVVILIGHATVHFALSGVPASGTFEISYLGNPTTAINFGDTAAQIQTKLRLVAGLSEVLVTGSLASQSLNFEMSGVYGASPALTVVANSLQTSAPAAITFAITIPTAGETWAAAITRTSTLVQYFGVEITATAFDMGQADVLAAAAVIQSLNKVGLVVSFTEADILPGGTIDLLRTGSFSKTRGLFYGDPVGNNALVYMASYAGVGFSVNFTGSNTTATQNLRTLAGVQPDPSMSQTIFDEAKAAGADIYVSLQGVPAIISNGANRYFDQIYNQEWIVGALQIAGFNFLQQAGTKIPQTESGMDGLKGAYRGVCEQGVTNEYLAPGTWTSPTTFGVQADFIANISQRGYYIFSQPVAKQLQVDRAARIAPLVQIALKEAGAIQSSSVLVNINP